MESGVAEGLRGLPAVYTLRMMGDVLLIIINDDMKKAKSEIVETGRANSKYYLSVLEKENDSGIMFNERIFFLLSGQHIGYLSDIKSSEAPDQIVFDKPKTTVLLTNLKSIIINATQLTLKFYLIDANKKSEKVWILKAET